MTLAFRSTLSSYGNGSDGRKVDFEPPQPISIQSIPNVTTGSNQTAQSLIVNVKGQIDSIVPVSTSSTAYTRLVLPSLAHPHIHLDKPYLLSHKDTSHLRPQTGTFEEALTLTAEAKPLYTSAALLERGTQLLAESSRAGVTHLRGFCEVDTSVNSRCIQAGIELKKAWDKCLYVQIAAFAQDPLFSTKANGTGLKVNDKPEEYNVDGNQNLKLLEQAIGSDGVEVLATTPYVEASLDASKHNIDWAIRMAIKYNVHLDFHLDYNLDTKKVPLVWFVLDRLKKHHWNKKQKHGKTICLGHCTRLTLFSELEWERLARETSDLPVYFIALPTSDLFMQGRPDKSESALQTVVAAQNRPRSTLHVPSMIQLGLKVAIGINNIGNAFTPFGSADPLDVIKWCVGIYQDGTAETAQTLYSCVSWGAKEAMGLYSSDRPLGKDCVLRENEEANLIAFGNQDQNKRFIYQRHSLEEIVWNPPLETERMVIYKGSHVDV